ncbi:MAG TPA: FAD-dependent monooxygenase [Candidatus Lustribacter sp.]|nr:FAD-dependent monooxygenase [Candidatus Lustribacter sp.]
MIETTVAIVGGGPVGLFLAAELGLRNVPVVVLSELDGTATHPKANTHTARSMELYRRHGISAELRAQGLSKHYRTDVAYYTRLLGHELHRVPLPAPDESIAETRELGTRWPTPEPQFRSSQLVLEPILLERARRYPSVDVRFRHRVQAIAERGDGVELDVELATGTRTMARADYVIGCDGGRSFVRRELGLRFEGEVGLSLDFMGGRMQTTYFRAPGLHARLRHPHAWQNWFLLPGLRALMLTLDADDDRYLLHYQLPADGSTAKSFQEVLDAVVGAPVTAEVISPAEWRAGVSLVAEQFRAGRCFLAGDAAHLFTPTGGFGLNTGIEDACNLAWKLAAVIAGWAPDVLLDTYQAERKPVAERNTAYALSLARHNGECPVDPAIEDDTPAGTAARAAARAHLEAHARWEYDTPGIQLGVSYRGSSIVVDDGSLAGPDSPVEYVPNAAPGSRLPHVWLPGGVSLYDKLGAEFTLIGLGAGGAAAWRDAAAASGVPLTILDLAESRELRALVQADWVLVRPDGHIAWRGDAAEPGAILAIVTAHIPERIPETA